MGIVYYMLKHGFYATKITAVRPNSSGKSFAAGEIELSNDRPNVHSSAFENFR